MDGDDVFSAAAEHARMLEEAAVLRSERVAKRDQRHGSQRDPRPASELVAETAGAATWLFLLGVGGLALFGYDGGAGSFVLAMVILFLGTPCGLVALVALCRRLSLGPDTPARTWLLAGVPSLAGALGLLVLFIG